ncbi:MAG: hypothetical protein RIS88_2166 [Pseudomonadota bacterium]
MSRLLQPLLALVLALGLAPAWAHKPSDSYLSLRAQADGRVQAQWDIALRDLVYLLELDRDGNAEITWGEVRQRSDDITALATARLQLRSGDQPCPWAPPDAARPLALDRHSDGTYAVLRLEATCPSLAKDLSVEYTLLFDVDPTHRGLVQWQPPGGSGVQARIFAADSTRQSLALAAPGAWETLRQYVAEGVWHIWIGFDHILFLLALLLPAVLLPLAGRWTPADGLRPALMDTVRVVTAFTIAHSITLSLAALQWVALPSRLVESVIAASVVLAAVNNLFPRTSRRRWQMALVFGLIHGFGFASVLADLGLPAGALLLALVGFNVGVELGQLAIVAAFLPLAYALRHSAFYRTGVVRVGSLLIAALAAWWLVERAFDL